MGRPSSYTKQGILESLLEAYDSGISLDVDDLKSAGLGGLLSAINRKKGVSKHLIFFSGLKDARNQLAEYLKPINPKKANSILQLNHPRRDKYNKRAIKLGLLEYFENGGELTGDALQETWMHNAIYYKIDGKFKTYGSLFDAREALAVFLEKKGRLDDASKVRTYNLPPERGMSENEKELRRNDLIEKLHMKVESGENLGHRAQQNTDRSFVNACNQYFGSYSKIFSTAGLKYSDFVNRSLNRSAEEYFVMFLDLIESAGTLQKENLMTINKRLIDKMGQYESGYFQALGKARLYYSGKMDYDMVRYIDDFLFSGDKSPRDTLARENAKRRKELADSIAFFDSKTSYDVYGLLNIKGKKSGKEIMSLAKSSGDWLESVPFTYELGMDRSNIKNLFHKYPDRILKFVFGATQKYLFHKSIIGEEKGSGKIFDRIVEQEIQDISESESQKAYFRKIIIPRLESHVQDKTNVNVEEMRRWFYEFGGTRAIEGYFHYHTGDMAAQDRKMVLEQMNVLFADYLGNREDNVYDRMKRILGIKKTS